MVSFGERLREERVRLEMTQEDFGALAGVTRKTQRLYEAGERAPDVAYLAAIATADADVLYVVTGRHSNVATSQHLNEMDDLVSPAQQLPADETLLLDAYRALGATKKKELLASLLTGGAGKKPAKPGGVTVSGSNNRAAGRDYHEKE